MTDYTEAPDCGFVYLVRWHDAEGKPRQRTFTEAYRLHQLVDRLHDEGLRFEMWRTTARVAWRRGRINQGKAKWDVSDRPGGGS